MRAEKPEIKIKTFDDENCFSGLSQKELKRLNLNLRIFYKKE